ncbi:MAG: ribose 5-phosphate isomerase B [Prevotellaceae bacterium]|jgi:ribose 5-phosphate isomerase B|nr:ribose 5-phosphate isomerase B [Prevotellaceae bacterium]
MNVMKVGIASDHAGFELKEKLKAAIAELGYMLVDFGTNSEASVDYPDYAHALAKSVDNQDVNLGIALCGTGNGMAMALNKHQHIRAGLAWEVEVASLIRRHNNANVCVLPARFVSEEEAKNIVKAYLTTNFEGGRHQSRIDKIPVSC